MVTCAECGTTSGVDHQPLCVVDICAQATYWNDRVLFDEQDPPVLALSRPLRRPGEEIELRAYGLDPDDVTEPVTVHQLPDLSHRREFGIANLLDRLQPPQPPGVG